MTFLTETLRVLVKILLSIALLGALAVGGFASWLFFYKSDLPDASAMAAYSPGGIVVVSAIICGEAVPVVAIPGANPRTLRQAVLASEGALDPRNFLSRYSDELTSKIPDHRYGHYSEQLARQMLCSYSGSNVRRHLDEIRTAIQMQRRFTNDQILDISRNWVLFAPGIWGAEEASRRYFGKHAFELSTAEAALLAGLIEAPARFSPIEHPERALARRNDVIDAMAREGSISAVEAATSKRSPLTESSH
jgi:penicillin-binding protein 1A